MATDSDSDYRWPLLHRTVYRFPADLAIVVIVVVLTGVLLTVPRLQQTPLGLLLGLPFVLFLPGYAFLAALFPESPENDDGRTLREPETDDDTVTGWTRRLSLQQAREHGSIDGLERVGFSFGVSISVVLLLGLVLNLTPWGLRALPIFVSIGGFVLVATGIAARRRLALPEEARFRVPFGQFAWQVHAELFDPDTRTDSALNVLLAVSVVLAVASLGYAVAVPTPGERYTEFYLLSGGDENQPVGDDYPTEFQLGVSKPLYLGIGNQESHQLNYTVDVFLQQVRVENETVHVIEERKLRRITASVPADDQWRRKISLTPTMTGDRLRLVFLLYRNDPPQRPTAENAYRNLHLWINVTANDSAGSR